MPSVTLAPGQHVVVTVIPTDANGVPTTDVGDFTVATLLEQDGTPVGFLILQITPWTWVVAPPYPAVAGTFSLAVFLKSSDPTDHTTYSSSFGITVIIPPVVTPGPLYDIPLSLDIQGDV